MICNHCKAENPDNAIFCGSCGERPLASEVSSSQPSGEDIQAVSPEQSTLTAEPSAQQLSFTEEPTVRPQPDVPASALPLSEQDLSRVYGAGGFADLQTLPSDVMSPMILPTPQSGPDLPPYGQGPIPQSGANFPPYGQGPMPPSETNLPFYSQGMRHPIGANFPLYGQRPMTPLSPARTLESRFEALAQPLPLWATLSAIAIVVISIIVLLFTGSDWAAGVMHAAIAAGIVGLLVLLAAGVRALAGIRQLNRFIRLGVAVLLCLLLSVTGIALQSTVHALQGSSLEGQKQWQPAITEFQLAGEDPLTTGNIARTYVEWGEQLRAQQQYQAALANFQMVLDSYSSATSEVTRAQSDKVAVLLAWGNQAMQQQDYNAATTRFDTLLNLSYCETKCQTQAKKLDGTAYYKLAESQLANKQYNDATSNFHAVLTRFPDSSEAKQLHPDLAQSILGQGKQQLASNCSSAIPTYQQLSKQFADTPAGQEATNALQAPQPVTGHFTGAVPHDPALTLVVFLAQNLNGQMSNDQILQAVQGVPTETIHDDGTFTFKSVSQGTYDLAWGSSRNTGSLYYRFMYNSSNNMPIYVATVGPLCPFDFRTIAEDVPTAP